MHQSVFATPEAFGDFAALDADRSSWIRAFSDRILADEIPEASYDTVLAFFVAEQIKDPKPFLKAVYRAMKPGAVFYVTTPHNWHPFPWAVRLVEVLGLTSLFASKADNINDYPAYYNMNTRRAVVRAVEGMGFDEVECMYSPCVQWDTFFPKKLMFILNLYDHFYGIQAPSRAQLMMFRLHKPADDLSNNAGTTAAA